MLILSFFFFQLIKLFKLFLFFWLTKPFNSIYINALSAWKGNKKMLIICSWILIIYLFQHSLQNHHFKVITSKSPFTKKYCLIRHTIQKTERLLVWRKLFSSLLQAKLPWFGHKSWLWNSLLVDFSFLIMTLWLVYYF